MFSLAKSVRISSCGMRRARSRSGSAANNRFSCQRVSLLSRTTPPAETADGMFEVPNCTFASMYLRFVRVPCEENKKFETNNANLWRRKVSTLHDYRRSKFILATRDAPRRLRHCMEHQRRTPPHETRSN